MTDPHADVIEAFKKQITATSSTYLGDPPTVDSRGDCTFCGDPYAMHSGSTAFAYDQTHVLRTFHRNDFGPNGYYRDEAKPE